MKKGFTLIELLIVVVVIITLMAVSFRVGSSSEDAKKMSETISRMQRLENCLSGYYAAYGSYPPVPLHGSRDYTYEVNNSGIQQIDRDAHKNLDTSNESETWERVKAACRSQPLAFECPFSGVATGIRKYLEIMRRQHPNDNKYFYDPLDTDFGLPGNNDKTDWKDVQIYKYGLMSFLLPRLLVTMSGGISAFSSFLNVPQWKSNNELPFDFESGQQYDSWGNVFNMFTASGGNERWKIEALPSQAVCARWLPNLEESVYAFGVGSLTFYGVDLRDLKSEGQDPDPSIYSGGNSQQGNSTSQMFSPKKLTVLDGWKNEFYYYSPSPHQSYTLWSAGKDGRTFPPWVPDEEIEQLSATDREMVRKWLSDDVVHMKN